MQTLQRRSVRKTAVVGGSVVLDCDLPLDQPQQQDSSTSLFLAETSPSSISPSDVKELDSVVEDVDSLREHHGAGHMIKWHKQGIEVWLLLLNKFKNAKLVLRTGSARIVTQSCKSKEDALCTSVTPLRCFTPLLSQHLLTNQTLNDIDIATVDVDEIY